MRRSTKKLLAGLLAVCMLVSLLPASALAAGLVGVSGETAETPALTGPVEEETDLPASEPEPGPAVPEADPSQGEAAPPQETEETPAPEEAEDEPQAEPPVVALTADDQGRITGVTVEADLPAGEEDDPLVYALMAVPADSPLAYGAESFEAVAEAAALSLAQLRDALGAVTGEAVPGGAARQILTLTLPEGGAAEDYGFVALLVSQDGGETFLPYYPGVGEETFQLQTLLDQYAAELLADTDAVKATLGGIGVDRTGQDGARVVGDQVLFPAAVADAAPAAKVKLAPQTEYVLDEAELKTVFGEGNVAAVEGEEGSFTVTLTQADKLYDLTQAVSVKPQAPPAVSEEEGDFITGAVDRGEGKFSLTVTPPTKGDTVARTYAISVTGGKLTLANATGFTNGAISNAKSDAEAKVGTEYLSVQYTASADQSAEEIRAALENILFTRAAEGETTVDISASYLAIQPGDVFYGGHIYRLSASSDLLSWEAAMNKGFSAEFDDTYPGCIHYPVTISSVAENGVLVNFYRTTGDTGIWLAAMPEGKFGYQGLDKGISYTVGEDGRPTYTVSRSVTAELTLNRNNEDYKRWWWIPGTPEYGQNTGYGGLPMEVWYLSSGNPYGPSSGGPIYFGYLGALWDDLNATTTGRTTNTRWHSENRYYVVEWSPALGEDATNYYTIDSLAVEPEAQLQKTVALTGDVTLSGSAGGVVTAVDAANNTVALDPAGEGECQVTVTAGEGNAFTEGVVTYLTELGLEAELGEDGTTLTVTFTPETTVGLSLDLNAYMTVPTYYVASYGSDVAGVGTGAKGAPYATVSQAVTSANAATQAKATVLVLDDLTLAASAPLIATTKAGKDVTVKSDAGAPVTITRAAGNGTSPMANVVKDAKLTLENIIFDGNCQGTTYTLTLTQPNSPFMASEGGTLTMKNVTLKDINTTGNNYSPNIIFAMGGQVSLEKVTVENCTSKGGTVYGNKAEGPITLKDCVIRNNRALEAVPGENREGHHLREHPGGGQPHHRRRPRRRPGVGEHRLHPGWADGGREGRLCHQDHADAGGGQREGDGPPLRRGQRPGELRPGLV